MPAAATVQELKKQESLAWTALQLVLDVPAYKRTWQQAADALDRWTGARDAAERCRTEDAWQGSSR